MPSDEPPPYPGLPSGDQQQQNQQNQQQHPQVPQDNSHYNEDTELSDDEEPSSRHLQVPNVPGMDEASRRSMEDEERPLPEGWVRQFDVNQDHHFYVDLRASPPRSTWHHPFDDPEYLQSIPDSDAAAARRLADDDGHSEVAHSARLNQQKKDEDENRSLGTKIKDKITGTTKKERDEKKRKEIAQERARQKQMQLLFLQRRAALRQAQTTRLNDPYVQRYYPNTGRVYAPPMGVYSRPAFGFGNYGGYGGFGYGGRPGFGAPMMMGGLGGLGAGMLLGGAMGGGYGGGFGGDCGGGGGGGDCGGGGGGC